MESLQKIVFKATIEPEKFKFYKLTHGPDECIRYLFLYAPNEGLIKKVIFIINEGEIKDYDGIDTAKFAFFENWEHIQKEVVAAGFEPIYLKQFATELSAIRELINEDFE